MIIESEISEIGFIRDSPTKGEKRITTREALKLNSKVLWVRCHKTKIAIAHELRSFFLFLEYHVRCARSLSTERSLVFVYVSLTN